MSITHGESGQSNSIQASSGIEVVDVSRVDGAPADLRPVDSPVKIGSKNWSTAEAAACEIIKKVQPTSVSEERRKEVIVYIQRLFRKHLGVEVLTYGSVPLKTYLPDGDIDLTAFGGANVEDSLVEDMKFVLDQEEKNTSAEFVVKDVQLIRAEVKLVKCIVQNIVVDVSFNQLGGLCTLCFLEKIDRLIGKDHLFKRSIILIKAWCYYESRILGAHHGLISTYGLETLVLYIFHIYHSTLDGPLAVLYKFLDYFSKFDWETYCISLNGPVRLSSLPKIVVEMPEDSIGDLLLSSDFLGSCVEKFSVPFRGGEQNSRVFQRRHLNIVDPMKDFNNLGRSVSKGNFYRVRSAFTYGAKKLGQILTQPDNDISKELHKFFSNTLSRHGDRQRPDVHDVDMSLDNSSYDDNDKEIRATRDSGSNSTKSSEDLLKRTHGEQGNNNQILTSHRFDGDANDLATSGISRVKISTDPLKPQFPAIYAPHLFFSKPKLQNGTTKGESESLDKVEKDQHCEQPAASVTKSLNLLTDLTGDYDGHLQCFQYGKMCYEGLHPMHAMPPPQFKRTAFPSQPHTNEFHQGPMYFVPPHLLMQGVPFGWEEKSKPRGTGTYFPSMNQNPQGYRPSVRPFYNNGSMIFSDPSMLERSTHEPSQSQGPVVVGFPQGYHPVSPKMNGFPKTNGVIVQPNGYPIGTPVVEKASSVSSSPKALSRGQKAEPAALSKDQDRITLTSVYHLKDEDDFPPLSV